MLDQKNINEWETLIDEHNKSGLSKIKFCQQKGISTSRFYYYLNQLKTKNEKGSAKEDPSAIPKSIIPIQIKHRIAKQSENEYHIMLILKNGLECVLPGTINKKELKEIIEVLTSC
jgi:hypothetical protein